MILMQSTFVVAPLMGRFALQVTILYFNRREGGRKEISHNFIFWIVIGDFPKIYLIIKTYPKMAWQLKKNTLNLDCGYKL